jgi:NAD-dependent dihydropyrimidine dehydrogenase PreA subunit
VIEFINADTCTSCNKCVEICPADVFERSGTVPEIARQDDCTSCMNCELYCHTDSIYVSPIRTPEVDLDKEAVIASGVLGSYARPMHWKNGQPPEGNGDNYLLQLRLRGGYRFDPNDRDYAIRLRLQQSFADTFIPVD